MKQPPHIKPKSKRAFFLFISLITRFLVCFYGMMFSFIQIIDVRAMLGNRFGFLWLFCLLFRLIYKDFFIYHKLYNLNYKPKLIYKILFIIFFSIFFLYCIFLFFKRYSSH